MAKGAAAWNILLAKNLPASAGVISDLRKKTAERIVFELKDKLGVASAWEAASAAPVPKPEREQTNEPALAVRDLQEKGEAKLPEELVKFAFKPIAAGRSL